MKLSSKVQTIDRPHNSDEDHEFIVDNGSERVQTKEENEAEAAGLEGQVNTLSKNIIFYKYHVKPFAFD